jgi:hypothetical protein
MKLEEELKQIENDVLIQKQIEEFEKIEAPNDEKYDIFFSNPELTEEFKLWLINNKGYYITEIKNPSEEIQLAAVIKYGDVIEYFKNPSEEVQLAAIKNRWWVIEFIQNPSEVVQLEAIKQDNRSFYLIQNPTEKVKELAKIKGVFIWN